MSAIVYVEPALALRTACVNVLRERGLQARAVDSVTQALIAVGEVRPSLILTAIELEDFPAASLVAALRASPYHRAISIGAVTSRAADDPQVKALGVDAVLHKRQDLASQLSGLLETLGLTERERLNARVLVVDDASVSRLLHAKLLRAAGAEVAVACDGVEALELCRANAFDLIQLDIEMPRLDGRATLRTLRARGLRNPIVALTGHERAETHAGLRADGFDDVLVKNQRGVLIERCLRALRRDRLSA